MTSTYAADGKSVSVDGQIEATNKIIDVTYTLKDFKNSAITGAIYSYTLKDAITAFGKNVETDTVLLVNVGKATTDAPGLELEVDFTKIATSHCGVLTLTVTAQVKSDAAAGSDDTVSSSTTLNMPCNLTSTKDTVPAMDFSDIIADSLITLTATLGGAKSSLGSSYDLEQESIAAYSTAQVKASADILNAIDLIFNGSKIMTPIGTTEVGYMSATYAASTSEAFLIPVASTATATTVGDLSALIDADKVVFSANVDASANSAFVVVTSAGMPVLVKVKALDSTTQVVTISYSKKK